MSTSPMTTKSSRSTTMPSIPSGPTAMPSFELDAAPYVAPITTRGRVRATAGALDEAVQEALRVEGATPTEPSQSFAPTEFIDTEFIESLYARFLPQDTTGNWPYSEIMQRLEIQRDKDHGVLTQCVEIQVAGATEHVMIRDARSAKDPKKMSMTSLAMQCVNHARGAERLLDTLGLEQTAKEEHVRSIRANLQKALKALSQARSAEELKAISLGYNVELINTLKLTELGQMPEDSIRKELFNAKEIAQIEDPAYHVATITTQRDKDQQEQTVIESDIAVLGITSIQKVQFEAIRDQEDVDTPLGTIEYTDPTNGKITKIDMRWYDTLKPCQKKSIKAQADRLIEGDSVIPTQLTDLIPGARNAYVKRVSTLDADGPKTLLESAHSGMIAFHGKGEACRVQQSKENIKQMQALFPQGSIVNINMLITPIAGGSKILSRLAGRGKELELYESATSAIRELGQDSRRTHRTDSSLTPFNLLRTSAKTEIESYNAILGSLGDTLSRYQAPPESGLTSGTTQRLIKGIGKCLKEGNALSCESAKRALMELKIPSQNQQLQDMRKSLLVALDAKGMMLEGATLGVARYDLMKRRYSIELSSAMTVLASDMSERIDGSAGVLHEVFGTQSVGIIPMCKSGKDRRAIQTIEATRRVLCSAAGLEYSISPKLPAPLSENLERQARGQHESVMAHYGGSRGCHGLQDLPTVLMPAYDTVSPMLKLKTSSFNKVKLPKDPERGLEAQAHQEGFHSHVRSTALETMRLEVAPASDVGSERGR